jgi:hypothetical protein
MTNSPTLIPLPSFRKGGFPNQAQNYFRALSFHHGTGLLFLLFIPSSLNDKIP